MKQILRRILYALFQVPQKKERFVPKIKEYETMGKIIYFPKTVRK